MIIMTNQVYKLTKNSHIKFKEYEKYPMASYPSAYQFQRCDKLLDEILYYENYNTEDINSIQQFSQQFWDETSSWIRQCIFLFKVIEVFVPDKIMKKSMHSHFYDIYYLTHVGFFLTCNTKISLFLAELQSR
jgi:cAMP phosphodiesterase